MIKISEVYNVSKAVEVGKCSKEMANRFIHRVTSGESLEEGLERNEVDDLLEKVKGINEEKLDNDILSANTSICRNDEGKIIAYKFDITRKGNIPLQGMLTTDEMQEIYRLYSLYGANITKRQINRLFPDYSYADFMRIIRAFQIFKASGPFAPHMYEEYTEEELKEMHIRLKENDFLKSVEKDEIKDLKKVNVSLAKQIIELKQQLTSAEGIKVDLTAMPTVPFNIVTSNRSLMLHLSDMHIGARVTSTAQFDNEWNEKELIRRLTGVLNKIDDLGQFDEIVVNMLGDSMDGMDQQTSRRDHIMPQNMDNHEQLHTYIKVMGWFFTQLKHRCNKVRMYSVPCGNHDGDFGYVANLYLAETLKQLDIPSTVYEKFMNHYEYKGHTFIICHGKDAYFMKKPFPLHLTPATEIYLRNYMDREGLDDCGKIHVIKGDLHSNALDANIKFTYRNVLSLFGDSDYSQANYPSNGYGVSYELFEGTEMISGVFENVLKMITRQKILEQAYIDCLTEMYKYAQPTLDFTAYRQSLKGKKEDPKDPLYARHYLSSENYKYIRNKYMRAYGISAHWASNVDVLIEDAEKGYNTDVYEEDTDGKTYRHYEQQPSLDKVIGVDAANKVIAFLKDRKQFYRFDREVTDFTASLAFGPSPNSNAEYVKQYWKKQGFDINIDEDFKVEDLDYGIEEED